MAKLEKQGYPNAYLARETLKARGREARKRIEGEISNLNQRYNSKIDTYIKKKYLEKGKMPTMREFNRAGRESGADVLLKKIRKLHKESDSLLEKLRG